LLGLAGEGINRAYLHCIARKLVKTAVCVCRGTKLTVLCTPRGRPHRRRTYRMYGGGQCHVSDFLNRGAPNGLHRFLVKISLCKLLLLEGNRLRGKGKGLGK